MTSATPVAPAREHMSASVRQILAAAAVRERCSAVYRYVAGGESSQLKLDLQPMPLVVDFVLDEIRQNYPEGNIPYHGRWRHFEAAGHDRVAMIRNQWQQVTNEEQARRLIEVTILSVLLDAGAGMTWRFHEPTTGVTIGRSEGLALASWHMYLNDGFGADSSASGIFGKHLSQLSDAAVEKAFQVSTDNPLVGVHGRCELLRNLGVTMQAQPLIFGTEARLGRLFDYIATLSADGVHIDASDILEAILDGLGPIWPGRLSLQGINLGDVWRHPAVVRNDETQELVAFHKLSQWLTYSLLEPFELAGFRIRNLDALTGLPEYRNGGLLTDFGVLEFLDHPSDRGFKAEDRAIIEWRACTVCLLDELGAQVRQRLGMDSTSMPLARILQGGTWSAGRRIAAQKRQDGGPPIKIISDGTVF